MDPSYRAFHDRHRGPRELALSHLHIYLPFVTPLKLVYDAPEALDLRCGRGEWLELLRHNAFQAKGVDLDEGMLLACRDLDLSVERIDALDYLKGLTSDSLSVVSAFHVVEHISFDVLRQLVDEAHRVLKPGGVLMFETPNPEHLAVGTSPAHRDPTRERPLPAPLLRSVVEYAGFWRIKTFYLQHPSDPVAHNVGLLSSLAGASLDYAVVAQKQASVEVGALFDLPFHRAYDLRLSALPGRYDQHAEARPAQDETLAEWLHNEWNATRQRLEDLLQRTTRLEGDLDTERQRTVQLGTELQAAQERENLLQAHADWLQNGWDAAKAKVDELNQASHQWWTVADQFNKELQGVHASTSWRITWPLRQAMRTAKWSLALSNRAARSVRRVPKRIAKPLVVWAMRQAIANPTLKARALSVLAKHPQLKQRLRELAERSALLRDSGTVSSQWIIETEFQESLSPRIARIYLELKQAIEARKP
jgi:SAM-dependent methyltransferase